MKNLLVLILGLTLGAGGYWMISHHARESRDEDAAEAKHGETKKAEAPVQDGVINLSKEQQAAAGLKFASPEPMRLPKQIKAYGRVLDPASVVTLALEVESARSALAASSKDFERVKSLYAQNQNASARAFETAEALVKRDRAQLSLTEAKLQTTVGPSLTKRENFQQIIDSLSQMKSALIRVDFVGPPPEKLRDRFRVASLANEHATVDAELLGPAPVAEAALQGNGYLGMIATNTLPANTALVAFFDNAADSQDGFLLPATAAVQNGDETLVFIQTRDDSFKKIEVELEQRRNDRIFVTGELSATNRVVVGGAHQILSISKAEAAD